MVKELTLPQLFDKNVLKNPTHCIASYLGSVHKKPNRMIIYHNMPHVCTKGTGNAESAKLLDV